MLLILYFFNGCKRTSEEKQLEEETALFHNDKSYPEDIAKIAEEYPNMSYTYLPSDTGKIKTIKGNFTVAVDAVADEEKENLYIKYIEKKYDDRVEERNLVNAGLESPAKPKHDYEHLFALIDQNTKLPPEAEERNIGATIFVEFEINEEGEVENATASESVYFTTDFELQKKLDQNAIKAVEATSGHWIPAKRNGEPTSMVLEIPVTFNAAESAS